MEKEKWLQANARNYSICTVENSESVADLNTRCNLLKQNS